MKQDLTPWELEVFKAIKKTGRKGIFIEELVKEFYMGGVRRYSKSPSNSIRSAIRQINRKSTLYFINGYNMGRGGKIVWIERKAV